MKFDPEKRKIIIGNVEAEIEWSPSPACRSGALMGNIEITIRAGDEVLSRGRAWRNGSNMDDIWHKAEHLARKAVKEVCG